MNYIRKILMNLILVNLGFLLLSIALPAVWGMVNQSLVDDWQYKVSLVSGASDSFELLAGSFVFLLLISFLLEFFRFLVTCGFILRIVVVMVIAIVVSIAGPMASSITSFNSTRELSRNVRGGKDINNFRANIAAGHLQPGDVTYEGLFSDYQFTASGTSSAGLSASGKPFVTTWSSAVSKNPLSGKAENFLEIGLKSQMSNTELVRKKLNLVVILDISDSMRSSFCPDYYDSGRRRPDMAAGSISISKLEAACSSLVAMLDQLQPEDRLGIVLFNHKIHLAKPVSLIGRTDVEAIKKHILNIEPTGTTAVEGALESGRKLLEPFVGDDPEEYANRIVFITDEMPRTDETSEAGLPDVALNMANQRIYLTFIGLGGGFDAQQVKSITQVKGANFYSVLSPFEFRKCLSEDFDSMVTPMVFDLTLTLKAPDCRIVKAIGMPEADLASSKILQVKTLFLSPAADDGFRKNSILLQLDKPYADTNLTMTLAYEDRRGKIEKLTESFVFKAGEPGSYDDAEIRKKILLVRYVDLLKNAANAKNQRVIPASFKTIGSSTFRMPTSRKLEISDVARDEIVSFREHFFRERHAIGDPELENEISVLDQLSNSVPLN